jgi:predicted small secreted protein
MMNTSSRLIRIGVLVLTAAACLLIASCNTVRGIGEDVSAAGQGLADVAQDISD